MTNNSIMMICVSKNIDIRAYFEVQMGLVGASFIQS